MTQNYIGGSHGSTVKKLLEELYEKVIEHHPRLNAAYESKIIKEHRAYSQQRGA